MSYPYLSDFVNSIFGTQLYFPIATFGSCVALSIIISSAVARKEVIRFEREGILPEATESFRGCFVPHQILSDLIFICSIFGIIGARVFHILEYPREFLDNPTRLIVSNGGFSFYGGLIFAFIAGFVFLKKRSIPVVPMLDALAPAMILGYGIGRIGCQISGDGDWGIPSDMSLKPNWLPDWLWAQVYENNIVGVLIPSPGVYPTPLYEVLMAFFIFSILWAIRKKPYSKGYVFSFYLLLSGFERLLIEKIRINTEYRFFECNFTQAELISAVLILIGLCGFLKSSQTRYVSKIAFSLIVLEVLSACSKL